ncbi:hypothetical protein K491DRAFT_685531 [Lophiostoma macrostomum CBS 122681]|uniref:Uncharacterized protein n=1 Tax=Lophiostoma macrostomum CBS 122681 TaxID=1314788 RepID=A0A6A6SKD0_9PLEO|nr:hypothetical protein K491DRAFT_685531 [Lophiostoma macrostomum CBS 122681]
MAPCLLPGSSAQGVFSDRALAQSLAEESMLKIKIASLASEMKVSTEQLSHVRAKSDENYDNYLGKQNSKICKILRTKIPREIRDMIYDCLQPGTCKTIGRGTLNPKTGKTFYQPATPYGDFRGLDATTRFEIVQHYYRNTRFQFEDPLHLKLFLLNDVWDQGSLPVTSVRNVYVNIDALEIHPIKRIKHILASLQSLYGLQVGSRIDIHLSAQYNEILGQFIFEQRDIIRRLLEVILPTILRLKELGRNFTLSLEVDVEYTTTPYTYGITSDDPRFSIEGQ